MRELVSDSAVLCDLRDLLDLRDLSDPHDLCDVWLLLSRVRKLKETLGTIQRLDKNMSGLRTWLARVEAELTRPVVYDHCHGDEIQKKLSEQQVGQDYITHKPPQTASALFL